MRNDKRNREITGRTVLYLLLAFFGVVFAVNAVMVKAATSTFGGVEVQSSYKAGLQFETEVARARAQDALHWRVEGHVARDETGNAVLELTVRDAKGLVVPGLTADARLAHPADERLDRDVDLKIVDAGKFRGEVPVHAGRWDLIVDLYRGDTRVFRSRSTVLLN